MFEPLIEKYIQRSRPAVTASANEARAWMGCILDELRSIRDILASDDVEYQRHPFRGNTANITPVEVPSADVWILESITVLGTGAGIFTLRDAANALRYAKALDSGNALADAPGAQRYTGGTLLTPTVSAGSAEYYLVFRSERPKSPPVPAGQFTAAPTFASSPGAADEATRHRNTGVFPGVNIIGAARAAHEHANGSGQ